MHWYSYSQSDFFFHGLFPFNLIIFILFSFTFLFLYFLFCFLFLFSISFPHFYSLFLYSFSSALAFKYFFFNLYILILVSSMFKFHYYSVLLFYKPLFNYSSIVFLLFFCSCIFLVLCSFFTLLFYSLIFQFLYSAIPLFLCLGKIHPAEIEWNQQDSEESCSRIRKNTSVRFKRTPQDFSAEFGRILRQEDSSAGFGGIIQQVSEKNLPAGFGRFFCRFWKNPSAGFGRIFLQDSEESFSRIRKNLSAGFEWNL